MQKQTRNRRPKPKAYLSGLRLANWKDDPERLRWAQTDPRFREVLSVLTNERHTATHSNKPLTENCELGCMKGYERALEVLLEMTIPPELPPASEDKPTYPKELTEEIYD